MSANNAAVVEISQVANRFSASIVLQVENKYIDVKSILGLFTTLLRDHGYVLHIHGNDSAEAEQALVEAFARHNMSVTVVRE